MERTHTDREIAAMHKAGDIVNWHAACELAVLEDQAIARQAQPAAPDWHKKLEALKGGDSQRQATPSAAPATAAVVLSPEQTAALAEFDAAAERHDFAYMMEMTQRDGFARVMGKSAQQKAEKYRAAKDPLFQIALQHEADHLLSRINSAYVASLWKRIKELEDRPGMRYRGTWSMDAQHNEGDTVTDHGSAWFCLKSTRSRPGDDPDSWQLMVKRGADGKDAR
jgi:hypothetical protein